MDAQTNTDMRELSMTRVFAAPRSLVFKAWTQPEHMARWWGCAAMVGNKVTNDLRIGGALRSEMTFEDGTQQVIIGQYLEIDEPERLSFTWSWEGGGMGSETVVRLRFVEQGLNTLMTLNQSLFDSADLCTAHNEGWTSSLERLDALLGKGAVV